VTVAYVGLGSNLGDREATLRGAVDSLGADPDIAVLAVSTFRETDPVGPVVDQPRFLNGAVAVETSLSARDLLGRLLDIERRFGREREGLPQGPRTLDLDLLVFGDERFDEPGLRVPHSHLHERRFALEPLVELAPALELPGYGPVEEILAGLH
jgi:2-amino-4-hydroxy-6-hydroxymethyldihydropteridine diphosphokinase